MAEPSPKKEPTRRPRARRGSVVTRRAPATVWTPREYQRVPIAKLAAGVKRQIYIWHRRAGKDRTALEICADEMRRNVGGYWHLFPKTVQAKKAIWTGVDPESKIRFLDQTFYDRSYTNDQDLFLRMPNGSTWQLGGSDNYDRLVGSNVLGVVFSEWALCDPAAWDYIRPILVENGGWAIFISTYRGRNHCYQMARARASDPRWFVDVRTILQTARADGSPVISAEAVDAEIKEGMRKSLADQEYYCKPEAALPGAVYGNTATQILEQRAGRVLHDPTFPVVAAWNLADYPANISVVFFQEKGSENAVIGSRSWMFETLGDCVADCATLPWRVSRDVIAADDEGVWPELMELLGRSPDVAQPYSHSRTAAITNTVLGKTYIDNVPRPYAQTGLETNNELLIDSLNGYRVAELADSIQLRDNFDSVPLVSYERYLARAVETFATWQFGRGVHRGPSKRNPDGGNYSAYDRSVI